MSYPKTSRNVESKVDKVQIQFLTESMELRLDKDKCTGCCVCVRACPKQAFVKYQPEGPTKLFGKQVILKKKHYYVPYIHDPTKCVFCGLCTYLCPFDALRLIQNGEEVSPEKIKLAELKAIPKLDYVMVKLDSGLEAKSYAKGTLSIDTSVCNVGCVNCAQICPTKTIKITPDIVSKDKGFQEDIKIEINFDKCIYCGACYSVCPTGALKLNINEIKYSGPHNSPFWEEVLERIKIKSP